MQLVENPSQRLLSGLAEGLIKRMNGRRRDITVADGGEEIVKYTTKPTHLLRSAGCNPQKFIKRAEPLFFRQKKKISIYYLQRH